MVFPVVMHECESWTIKNPKQQIIDAFKLWFWRRLLRIPWTARRSNQSILKEISPEYSLEGLMLKLKLQYFDHLMWRTDSLLGGMGHGTDARKDWGQEGAAEDEMVEWHHQLNGPELEWTSEDSEGQGSLVCRSGYTGFGDWIPTKTNLRTQGRSSTSYIGRSDVTCHWRRDERHCSFSKYWLNNECLCYKNKKIHVYLLKGSPSGCKVGSPFVDQEINQEKI